MGTFVIKPPFWQAACDHLMEHDPIMRKLIPQYPGSILQSRGDGFMTLARNIVGQQISTKAAQTLWNRLMLQVKTITPETIQATSLETLRQIGLSNRKATYLLHLSCRWMDGSLPIEHWSSMEDEAILQNLITLKGIGRWTAEMFLMFHLLRPNVLPLGDAGLIKAIKIAYFSNQSFQKNDIQILAQSWQPFCSVATWYLWRSLEPLPIVH